MRSCIMPHLFCGARAEGNPRRTAVAAGHHIRRMACKVCAISLCCTAMAAQLLSLSACTGGDSIEKDKSFDDELALHFSDAGKVVRNVRGALSEHAVHITVSFEASGEYTEDMEDVTEALMEAALAVTDDPTQGDYIRYQYGGYTYTYDAKKRAGGWEYEICITPRYYTNLEQEQKVDEAVDAVLGELGLTKRSSDYEKVKAVYDYIYENVNYDTVRRNHRGYHLKSTAYAALIQHSAVCQGYSTAMYRLLKEVGVDAKIITGTATYEGEDTYHAWNLVCIDGLYYNLDVTWDKALDTDEYFLKADDSVPDHVRDEEFAAEDFYKQYLMAAQDYSPDQ